VLLLYVLSYTYKSPVFNKLLGFKSNAFIFKGAASKSFIIYYTIFLVTNELLNTSVNIDNKDLLLYSYK
jgi:hypothetical protein